MKTAWQSYLSQKNKGMILSISLACLGITMVLFTHFLAYNETRIGFNFNDPVLSLFKPVDVSFITLIITYSFSLFAIVLACFKPTLFVQLAQAFTLILILRILCMYFVPLEPPTAIIPLEDGFLRSYVYSGRPNLRDLFFSGHTASMCLFAYCFTDKKIKWMFVFGAIIIGTLVTLQHVHYSIDVMAAPVFVYIAVWLQKKINLQ